MGRLALTVPFLVWWGVLTACATLSGGCATLLTGVNQDVHFVSEPPGARVVLDNGKEVRTPGTLRIDKARFHVATFELEGHQPETVDLVRRVQWYVLGDVFFLIVPGLLADFLVGGAFALPEEVSVTLEPLPAPEAAPAAPEAAPTAPEAAPTAPEAAAPDPSPAPVVSPDPP